MYQHIGTSSGAENHKRLLLANGPFFLPAVIGEMSCLGLVVAYSNFISLQAFSMRKVRVHERHGAVEALEIR